MSSGCGAGEADVSEPRGPHAGLGGDGDSHTPHSHLWDADSDPRYSAVQPLDSQWGDRRELSQWGRGAVSEHFWRVLLLRGGADTLVCPHHAACARSLGGFQAVDDFGPRQDGNSLHDSPSQPPVRLSCSSPGSREALLFRARPCSGARGGFLTTR